MEREHTNALIEPHKARMASFEWSMQRLAARWARKLEIEARECEHAESATRRSQHNERDQQENRRKAILGLKVQIERINHQLDNLPPPGSLSQYGQPIRISQQSIANLIQRRLEHEAALAELKEEDARLAALSETMGEERRPDLEQLSEHTLAAPVQTRRNNSDESASLPPPTKGDTVPPPVEVRKVAPGVGLPLVDLTKSTGTIAKETRRAAIHKGAPYREVPDMERIRKALEYRTQGAPIRRRQSTNLVIGIRRTGFVTGTTGSPVANNEPHHQARSLRQSPRSLGRCSPALCSLRKDSMYW